MPFKCNCKGCYITTRTQRIRCTNERFQGATVTVSALQGSYIPSQWRRLCNAIHSEQAHRMHPQTPHGNYSDLSTRSMSRTLQRMYGCSGRPVEPHHYHRFPSLPRIHTAPDTEGGISFTSSIRPNINPKAAMRTLHKLGAVNSS